MDDTARSAKRAATVRFLKRYAAVSDKFVDDFYALVDPTASKKAFSVDVAAAAKWLKMTKGNLMRSLKMYGFEEDRDYSSVVDNTPANAGKRPQGRPTHVVRLTTECMKGVCMALNTPKSREVRGYFIAAEEALIRYQEELEAGLQQRIAELERNQRGPAAARALQGGAPGVIYVARAARPELSVFKVGRSKDLAQRLRSHEAALAHGLDIVFVFKTDNMVEVEACVKTILRTRQYKKCKEVYQVGLDTIKHIIASCEDSCSQVRATPAPRRNKPAVGGAAAAAGGDEQFFVILQRRP